AQANNVVPPTAFRVVATRADQAEVLAQLREAGATVEPSQVAEDAWRVSGATSVLRELTAAGHIYLQDEASQLVAHSLNIKPGERVLDLCAAPGGKTTLMADHSRDKAMIVAADRSATRMETVIGATRRQQLKSIQPLILDAAEQLPFNLRTFDKVLVDAPCSGTGTLRRNPEIRWRLSPADIGAFAKKQKQILSRAAEALKPGGRLVYSTCSVETEENEDVVRETIARDSRFRSLKTSRTWPHRDGCDGFFILQIM
ncbi:MAG TPA: RsmB/NOP family class I SAM-dependent RNA methyltransferase, partial [Pyrinomonadaceae bacterium]|nr:RsmB/NOP family class I SAM-dependent RNA methyltransferase [Pyrinomonadaceae bacterium]